MKPNRIDHISIAVKDLESAKQIWQPMLGKKTPDDEYTNEAEAIQVARYWIGEVALELMASTSPGAEVAKFIEKNGEGIMLISLNVENARKSRTHFESRGYPFAGPVRPFRDGEYTFVHPKKMTGVLLELIDGQANSD